MHRLSKRFTIVGFIGPLSSYVRQACYLLLCLALTVPLIVRAADGGLDATFGEGGRIKTDFDGNLDFARAIATQPDGKVVVAGVSQSGPGAEGFALARYNEGGSLDQSFGSGGKVITSDGGLRAALALAILADGKVLAAGGAYRNGEDFGMARYTRDGTRDSTFGEGGIVTTNLGGAETAFSIAIQPNGKVLLAGSATGSKRSGSSFAVVRYDPAGRIDRSFGKDGAAILEFSSDFDSAHAMALQSDGKIVLAGAASLNSNSPFALARFNGDGTLDTTFGMSGKVTTNFFGRRNRALAVTLQPDGKIAAAGWAARPEDGREILAIARYTPNGALDSTFGTAGMVTNDFAGRGGEARSIKIQPDGKIVVAGIAGFERAAKPQIDFAVVRYSRNGTPDSTFGAGGVAIADFRGVSSAAHAMTIRPNGQIVVAGSTCDDKKQCDFAIARYNR